MVQVLVWVWSGIWDTSVVGVLGYEEAVLDIVVVLVMCLPRNYLGID